MGDEANKKKMGTAVFEERHPSMSEADKQELLTVDFLKKYLRFCKDRNVTPQLSKEASEEIGVNYASLRQRMVTEANVNGQLAVTTRTLEAIIRMSTAHAKLRMSAEVSKDDVKVACQLLQESRHMEVQSYDDVLEAQEREEEKEAALKMKKKAKKRAAKEEEENEEDDDDAKRKKTPASSLADAVFMRLKNELFHIFMEKKTLDISVAQFEKHLTKKDIKYTPEEVRKTLEQLEANGKLVVEDNTIFLTT